MFVLLQQLGLPSTIRFVDAEDRLCFLWPKRQIWLRITEPSKREDKRIPISLEIQDVTTSNQLLYVPSEIPHLLKVLLREGENLPVRSGLGSALTGAARVPGGVVVSSRAGEVARWKDGQVAWVSRGEPARGVAWFRDRLWVGRAEASSLDPETGQALPKGGALSGVWPTANGLVAGYAQGRLDRYRRGAGALIAMGHPEPILGALGAGEFVVSWGASGTGLRCQGQSGKASELPLPPAEVVAGVGCGEREAALVTRSGEVVICDLARVEVLARLQISALRPTCVGADPSGQRLLVGGDGGELLLLTRSGGPADLRELSRHNLEGGSNHLSYCGPGGTPDELFLGTARGALIVLRWRTK